MAALRKPQLLQKLIVAAALSGWSIGYNGNEHHPFHLLLSKDGETEAVLVYIWNITHGGGAERPSHEYRIQITGVPAIDQIAGVKTLLLGYWEEKDVFAGWDAVRHSGPVTGFSPSFQIREEYLLQAANDGLAVCPRGSTEVAVAFSPGSFINYVRNLYGLHGAVSLAEQQVVTQIAQARGQVNEAELAPLPLERQIVVRTVAERQRATNFRQRVLTAYHSRCAVCGLQMRLVDAAHIVPVRHTASNDEINNGLCLCALHHRAFDQGLIAVLPNYQVAINRTRLNDLQMQNLSGGADDFVGYLRAEILRPVSLQEQPNKALIRTALRVRELHNDRMEPVQGRRATT